MKLIKVITATAIALVIAGIIYAHDTGRYQWKGNKKFDTKTGREWVRTYECIEKTYYLDDEVLSYKDREEYLERLEKSDRNTKREEAIYRGGLRRLKEKCTMHKTYWKEIK